MEIRKKVRLLVVDEQEGFCEMVQQIADLAEHAYEISCQFTNCEERARELVREWDPSVILVDAHLSEIDSGEFVRGCKELRAPVVVTSQERSVSIEHSARLWGASGYFTKSDCEETVEKLVLELATIAPVTDHQYH